MESLVGGGGATLGEFQRTLKPRWAIVWRDILAGHAVIAACVAGLVYAQALALPAQVVCAVAGAVVIGYAIAYLFLFFHEAAHYNIAPSRRLNDLLANAAISVLAGQDIRAYRPIHFAHHRLLGTVEDTERTYFQALDARFLAEAMTGVLALRVLLGREASTASRTSGARRSTVNAQLLLGVLLHALLLALALAGGHWVLAAAWIAGVGVAFPFFAALRQLLEHRDPQARAGEDYRKVAHGEFTRTFGDGPLASTFGAAGFNRHLLHHWLPQLSYTQLPAMEAFILTTSARDAYLARRSTYSSAFRQLYGAGKR